MGARSTGCVIGVIAVLSLGACAELRKAAAPLLSAEPATSPAESGGVAAPPGAATKEPAPAKPRKFPGTGQFIDRQAASLPEVEITESGDVILNFAGADLHDVVRTVLGTTLKLNYVMHPKVQGKVTVQTSRPLARAALLSTLESILRLHGAALVKSAGVYKVIPANEAPRAVLKPRLGPAARRGGPAFGVQIVPLEFISATEMNKILDPFAPPGGILRVDSARNLLMLAGTRDELANLLEIVDIFDVDWLAGRSVALFPLQTAEASAVIKDLKRVFGAESGEPLEGLVRFIPIERVNSILVISARPDYLERAQTWIERLDSGFDSDERGLHVYLVQNGRAADLADILNRIYSEDGNRPDSAASRAASVEPAAGGTDATPAGRTRTDRQTARQTAPGPATRGGGERAGRESPGAALPSRGTATASRANDPGSPLPGKPRIIADEKNNALVVLATPREYRSVLGALRKLDIPPLQVLIEATIAEVTLKDELRYGLQWFFRSGSSSFTQSKVATGAVKSIFSAQGGFSYLLGGGDVRVVLDALSSITDVNVISSPQLMVLDNQTATLQVGAQVPVSTQQSIGTTDDARTVNTIQFRDTGVILTVTPRVNAGGLVQMEVTQEVSSVVATAEPTVTPTITQRRVQTVVAVQSGETVALGGLIEEKKTKIASGIPFLSQIPLLGVLFGSKSDEIIRTELLVLITPRVVRNQREARIVTEELRSRLRAVVPLGRRIE